MKKLLLLMIVIALVASLSACVTTPREMPENDGDAADKMRRSPCACVRLEHNNGGFRWVS